MVTCACPAAPLSCIMVHHHAVFCVDATRQAITANKVLREQIDNMRRERLMFEAIDANLIKELARSKRSIAGA